MANHRLIHKEAATGARTTELDAFEFRVWVQYVLSADDFGVCPATSAKLQGDNRWLEKQPVRRVQAAIERLITVRLVQVFADHGTRYLYQHDWQDWQRIKHTTATSLPPIPAEVLEKCSPKTSALFRDNHPKVSPELPPHAGACVATANANASDPGEGVQGKPAPLIVSSLEWERIHGKHVTGFCDWVCLPRFIALEFAGKSGNPGDADSIRPWAHGVRAQWESRTIGDDSLVFWRKRWAESHPDEGREPSKADQTRAAFARAAERRGL